MSNPAHLPYLSLKRDCFLSTSLDFWMLQKIGRQGDCTKNRETPGKIGRVGISDWCMKVATLEHDQHKTLSWHSKSHTWRLESFISNLHVYKFQRNISLKSHLNHTTSSLSVVIILNFYSHFVILLFFILPLMNHTKTKENKCTSNLTSLE